MKKIKPMNKWIGLILIIFVGVASWATYSLINNFVSYLLKDGIIYILGLFGIVSQGIVNENAQLVIVVVIVMLVIFFVTAKCNFFRTIKTIARG